MLANRSINYLDLFSGIGGFHLGLTSAGVEIKQSFYSEIDKYAISVYSKQFNNSIPLGDVRTITKEAVESRLRNGRGNRDDKNTEQQKINLITFGFPCQDLSVAGHKKGLEGSRSSLFFEAMRVVKELQPDYFIFENVKGLLSNREGRDFEIVLQEVTDSGYDGEWQLVNTSWFLPQNRERVYFIGHPRGKPRTKVFPLAEHSGKASAVQSEAKREQNRISSKVSQREGKDELSESRRGNEGRSDSGLNKFLEHESQGYRVYKTEGCSVSLTANTGGVGGKTGLYAIPVLTPDRLKKRQNGRRFKEHNDSAFTLTAQDRHGVYDGHYIRRLTPLECERLQGFPDGWTDGLSDTQKYKCLGNAVTVDVVSTIVHELFRKE